MRRRRRAASSRLGARANCRAYKGSPIGGTIDLTCDDPELACDDLERDPEIVRALIAASWDETGRTIGQGNDWDRTPGKCHAA
ncbi:MAG: hypothetical protein ACXU95_18780, partial [Isosphaeraceae bacterium]